MATTVLEGKQRSQGHRAIESLSGHSNPQLLDFRVFAEYVIFRDFCPPAPAAWVAGFPRNPTGAREGLERWGLTFGLHQALGIRERERGRGSVWPEAPAQSGGTGGWALGPTCIPEEVPVGCLRKQV